MRRLPRFLLLLVVSVALACRDDSGPTAPPGGTAVASATPVRSATSTPAGSNATPTATPSPASTTPVPTATSTPIPVVTPSPSPTVVTPITTPGLYVVRGTVFDAVTMHPVPGATVLLVNYDHGITTQQQLTGPDGRYRFDIPYCDTCFETAQHPDYYGAQAFAGTRAPQTIVDFYLAPR